MVYADNAATTMVSDLSVARAMLCPAFNRCMATQHPYRWTGADMMWRIRGDDCPVLSANQRKFFTSGGFQEPG